MSRERRTRPARLPATALAVVPLDGEGRGGGLPPISASPSAVPASAVAAALAVLVVANVASNRLLPDAAYVPWNLAVAGALVVIALRWHSRDYLGFANWRRGALVGGALVVATAALFLTALAIPSMRDAYDDRRTAVGLTMMLYHVAVRIPLGTVVLEEIAFRSVIPGLLATRVGVLRASVAASVLFGLWHVLPAWNLSETNAAVGDVVGHGPWATAAAVTLSVIGTAIAGLWLCLVRYRSRSVLAPVLAHCATNCIGFVVAWAIS